MGIFSWAFFTPIKISPTEHTPTTQWKCTVRSKKMSQFEIWISPKVTGVGLRYLWGIYINIISFFSHNFHGRNFYPRRNFDRKPKIEGVRKGKKSILEVKKFDFFAILKVIRTIWRETPKMIYVHISWLIEHENRPNRLIYWKMKNWIFWPFSAHFLLINSA